MPARSRPRLKKVVRQWSDEAFVNAWRRYAEEVQAAGTCRSFNSLSRAIVLFLIQAGMEQRCRVPDRHAERKRIIPRRKANDGRASLGGLRRKYVWDYMPRSRAGYPSLWPGTREDFIVARLRPDSGGTNLRRFRRPWGPASCPGTATGTACGTNLTTLVPGSPFDRFVLLSEGNYSAVAPETLSLETGLWKEQSLRLRLEHEGVHYATKRLFGTIRNTLHDELLADSFAVFLTTGSVRTDWLLHFFGLEHYPELRMSGRLANYRGHPRLSDEAFAVLARLAVLSISNIAAAFHLLRERLRERSDLLLLLASMTAMSLEEFALPDGAERMVESILARVRDVSSPL